MADTDTFSWRTYSLEIIKWRNDDTLVVEARDFNKRFLFEAPITKLFGSEQQLNGGRFEKYCYCRQENSVGVCLPDFGGDFRGDNAAKNQKKVDEIFEWIAIHCDGKWSLRIEATNSPYPLFMFSFENDVAAVLFALIFS